MPAISVVLPVYNAELYLKDAIESILSQTFTDFELLIYNDGSTDNSHQIIESYKDERIIYKKLGKNLGYVPLLNEGLKVARGKYIARMDADDIALPNRFDEQYNYLESNPDVGICGSWYEYIGEKTGVNIRPETFEEIRYHLFFGCPLTHPTIMMRRMLLEKYNLHYEESYSYAEDHDLFASASLHFQLVNLPQVLLKYRIHSTQIGSFKWKEQYIIKCRIQSKIFSRTLVTCSNTDKLWLDNFFTESSRPDAKWLSKVEHYKQRIIGENLIMKTYPVETLNKAANEIFRFKLNKNIYNYFFNKYYNQRIFNIPQLRSFFNEPLKAYKYLGPKLTLFLIIKCIIGYKKSSTISI